MSGSSNPAFQHAIAAAMQALESLLQSNTTPEEKAVSS